MAKTRDRIADDMFGECFDDLAPGQKAAVTRKFLAQGKKAATPTAPRVAASGTVSCTIGRVGVNGTKTCLLPVGSTVKDLVEQSGVGFDTKKEGIVEQSTGARANLTDALKHNETYAITVEIKSA